MDEFIKEYGDKSKIKIISPNTKRLKIILNNESSVNNYTLEERISVSDALKLLNPDNIIDINISNIPLENIISDIYVNSRSTYQCGGKC